MQREGVGGDSWIRWKEYVIRGSNLQPTPLSFALSEVSAPDKAAGGSHGAGYCSGYAGTPHTLQPLLLQQTHKWTFILPYMLGHLLMKSFRTTNHNCNPHSYTWRIHVVAVMGVKRKFPQHWVVVSIQQQSDAILITPLLWVSLPKQKYYSHSLIKSNHFHIAISSITVEEFLGLM